MKMKDKISRFITQISFQNRKEKRLQSFTNRIDELQKMECVELEMEYIDKKTKYEEKKLTLSVFMIAILLSVVMEIWQVAFQFIERLIQYFAVLKTDVELMNLTFILTSIMVLFITIVVVIILISHTRSIYKLHRELLIIEEAKKRFFKEDTWRKA